MPYYLVHLGKDSRDRLQKALGDKFWAQLQQAPEAAIKEKLGGIVKRIQDLIADKIIPDSVGLLFEPGRLAPEVLARNLASVVRGKPCLVRLDDEGTIFKGPDGGRFLVFRAGAGFLISHIYLESPVLPRGAEPVRLRAAAAGAGGGEEEEGEGIEALMARVEKQIGSSGGKAPEEAYRWEVHLTAAAVERYQLQGVAKSPGIQHKGHQFFTLHDARIPRFFRDVTFDSDLGGGVMMTIETSYGSTDLRFHRGGKDLFILTKITRDDLARGYIYVDLKPANPTDTKKVEQADVIYRLSEVK